MRIGGLQLPLGPARAREPAQSQALVLLLEQLAGGDGVEVNH